MATAELTGAFVDALAAAARRGRRVTFLHVPKCFGTAVVAQARRLFPDLPLDAGHRTLHPEAGAAAPDAVRVTSLRRPAERLRSLVLHAARGNHPGGFCPPERYPLLTAFLVRPTPGRLRAYLAGEYWHASYPHWFRTLLGSGPAEAFRERAATVDARRPDIAALLDAAARTVVGAVDLCLHDEPAFLAWLPRANAADEHFPADQRRRRARLERVVAATLAGDPGLLAWEERFYAACVREQQRRSDRSPAAAAA